MFDKKQYLREYQLEWYHRNKYKRGLTTKAYQRKLARKTAAVKLFGGKCSKCGYSKCIAALEFHHKDGRKESNISYLWSKKLEVIQKELEKCILVCANCHREVHYAEEDVSN